MKIVLAIILLMITSRSDSIQSYYTSNDVAVSLFSEAPLEDIKAESEKGISALNAASGSVYFKVAIRSFEFEKALMQEHFNENYMESDKYPEAEFKGKILEPIDLSKDRTYPVTVHGNLKLHNVTKPYVVHANLTIQGGEIGATAVFQVKLADHRIKIPRLVIRNIAEVVQVRVSAQYERVSN